MAQMLKGEVMVGKDEHELCFAMVRTHLCSSTLPDLVS